ncbi:MAG: RNA methyltransferase [Myxococcales bacterium]|nr:RNA methyltransferase [Myxococcales bacterium]
MPERFALFATASRGTEDLLAQELEGLGARKVRQDRGGVRFSANLREALRVCLWTRIAMRVLYPLAEAEAKGAEGLYRAAAAVPWEEHLDTRSTFSVEATLRGAEHTHSGFVALKVKDAIADRLRDKLGARPDVDTRHPKVRVVAHLAQTRLALSLDLCGEPLHRRGYRVRQTEAPLKETLAAAILAAAGYQGEEPLADPMCGSGTLCIEAGLIATRRAPSLSRPLSVEKWPHLGEIARRHLSELREEARQAIRAAPFPICGFDRSPEALEAARHNARAAKLEKEISLEAGDATILSPPPGPPGLIATNPPYGARLGGEGQKGMKAFYFKLGESLSRWEGWRMAILSGNPAFESAFHARPKERRRLWNGPIECRLLLYPSRGGASRLGAP